MSGGDGGEWDREGDREGEEEDIRISEYFGRISVTRDKEVYERSESWCF